MLTLLPHIEIDQETKEESSPYLILYNIDLMNILSIEPDDKGRTIIYQKIGGNYTFNVAFSSFLSILNDQNLVSLWFKDDVHRTDSKVINKLK